VVVEVVEEEVEQETTIYISVVLFPSEQHDMHIFFVSFEPS